MTVVACSEQSELIISLYLSRIYHEGYYKDEFKSIFHRLEITCGDTTLTATPT